jgi:hypothetical protein
VKLYHTKTKLLLKISRYNFAWQTSIQNYFSAKQPNSKE